MPTPNSPRCGARRGEERGHEKVRTGGGRRLGAGKSEEMGKGGGVGQGKVRRERKIVQWDVEDVCLPPPSFLPSVTTCRVILMEKVIENLPDIWSLLDSAPQTMTHNDCNPRNICLRLPTASRRQPNQYPSSDIPSGLSAPPPSDPRILCIYDWELACVGVPQHDVVEFLAFTLQPLVPLGTWLAHVRSYWGHLQKSSGQKLPWDG